MKKLTSIVVTAIMAVGSVIFYSCNDQNELLLEDPVLNTDLTLKDAQPGTTTITIMSYNTAR